MITPFIDGVAISLYFIISLGFLFFGLGGLSNPETWRHNDSLTDAQIYTVIGTLLSLLALALILT